MPASGVLRLRLTQGATLDKNAGSAPVGAQAAKGAPSGAPGKVTTHG